MSESLDISEIFKQEYSNLVAVLYHYYNVSDIHLAEDLVSETFVKAMKTWSHKGIPDSPKSWLRKTAKNLMIDHFRRQKTFDEKISPAFTETKANKKAIDITDEIVEDSQLKMIFVVCDPSLNKEAQLCLALRILSGFSIDEIAIALLSNKETINKKLYRAKQALKLHNEIKSNLSKNEYSERLDNVLRVIYLIFNEGYYSSIEETTIRQDLCWEAMSLCKFLTHKSQVSNTKTHALMALMCFHASRFEARLSNHNAIQLYDQQDKSNWDHALIQKGEEYLNKSAVGNIVSKYHLEAAIGYWHTTSSEDKWNNILQLYNKLLTIEYSPIIAMNRTYVLALANSVGDAIKEALKLDLEGNHYYYCLLAELYQMQHNTTKKTFYLKKALKVATKSNEIDLINLKLNETTKH